VKDQYFGDENHYRKYGLLRCLQDAAKLDLGVCWMLTKPGKRKDGERRRYLRKPERDRWSGFDQQLYDLLTRLNNPNVERTVQHAKDWELLPRATYFPGLLDDNAASRESYFQQA